MRSRRGLLGYYNYTVILTYIGMLTAFWGITFTIGGRFRAAVICLMAAGFCDMFDGAIASTRPRMPKEKRFGIQIDSLSDLICFGVFPALLVYLNCNSTKMLPLVVCGLYVLCALIRLSYFNVDEEERQNGTTEHRDSYLGLPVTTIALLLPAMFGLDCLHLVPIRISGIVLLACAGAAFLIPFRLKKPYRIGKVIMIVVGALEFCVLALGAS